MIIFLVKFIPMKILELLSNPRPASLCETIALRAREGLESAGNEVLFHDLYEEGFDPVLDSAELARGFSLDPLVQTHCRQLSEVGGLIVLHPLWWGGPPAMLKGWIDRVLRQGIGYDLEGGEFSDKSWTPLLLGKKALVLVTSDEDSTGTLSRAEAAWKEDILGKCGMDCDCRILGGLRRRSASEKAAWMEDLDSALAASFPAGARLSAKRA